MESKSDNKIKIALIAFIAVIIADVADAFFIKSNNSIFDDLIFARIAGIIIIFVAAKKLKFNIKGRCLNTFGVVFEILYGIGFSAAALALVYGVELIYFKIKGFYADAKLFWVPPNSEGRNLLAAAAAYVFAVLLYAFFKELFRGFLLNQFFRKFGLKKTNYIQAGMMTLLFCISIIGMAVQGGFDNRTTVDVWITIAASVIATFVSAVKWGYYYRVNGSIWMALADDFVNSLVVSCIYFSPDRLPERWILVKCLVVQIISCIIFIPFYYRRERVNAEYIKEAKIRHEVLSSMKASMEADEKSEEYLMMMNDKSQDKKFAGTKENEISDFVVEPQNLSQDYFTGLINKSSRNKNEETAPDLQNIAKEDATVENDGVLDFNEAPQAYSADFYKGFVDRSIRTEAVAKKSETEQVSDSNESNSESTENKADAKEILDFTKTPHSYSEDFFKEFMEKLSRSRSNSHRANTEKKTDNPEAAKKISETDSNEDIVDFNSDPHALSSDFFKGYVNRPHRSRSRSEHSGGTRASSHTHSHSHSNTESSSHPLNEILDFDQDPQSFSNAFFRSYVDKSHKVEAKKSSKKRKSRTTETVPDNMDNISKLVDEYFKKQFDKHTYSK